MKPTIHYLGIRHHGVGSAKRLLQALDHLQPDAVLIEGPADCTELLPFLTDKAMKPPVSLLAYNDDHPDHHVYYPFTTYSPEYQAVQWAHTNGSDVAFIDIPTDIQLSRPEDSETSETKEENTTTITDDKAQIEDTNTAPEQEQKEKEQQEQASELSHLQISQDPIGALAKYAGYEDGESWWNDYFEQNRFGVNPVAQSEQTDSSVNSDNNNSLAIFAQVADAMQALRESEASSQKALEDLESDEETYDRNSIREAYMRLQIVKHSKALQKKSTDNLSKEDDCSLNDSEAHSNTDIKDKQSPVIAVVCGAWHVPALTAKIAQKDDRATIKSLPKKLPAKKIKRTWIPWTTNRLSRQSGYGAGVTAPMWYQHLWDYHDNDQWLPFWVGKVTHAMRAKGHIMSTASVIETVRLSHSLAVIRGRPQAGFEEIIDAVIACLCFGESVLWHQVAEELLLGHEVGEIPENLPLAPLLEDLQRQQKAVKLKAETLYRELSLDLRSDSGNKRSVLLHRLNLLDVPWGELTDSGRSRGTFRENWILEWQPDYSVQLVENLVYGNSIEQASNNKVIEKLQQDISLDKLAEYVQLSLTSALQDATEFGLTRLSTQAVRDTDVISLLATIPHLVGISRYGTARKIDLGQIDDLLEKLVIQSAFALPMDCHHLNPEESERYRSHVQDAHHAIMLAELPNSIMENWWQALSNIANSSQSSMSGLLVGLTNHLLYQAEKISTDTVENRLRYALSPALDVASSAQFFDGFFSDAIARLHYNKRLLNTVNEWILTLSEDDFMTCLPLLMRTFSSLDKTERHRLLVTLLGKQQKQSIYYEQDDELMKIWEQHFQILQQSHS